MKVRLTYSTHISPANVLNQQWQQTSLNDGRLCSSNILSEVIKLWSYPNKAHGQVEISVKILKLCVLSVCQPLTLIFESWLGSKHFPGILEKKITFVILLIKTYRPVSLLSICGNLWRKLMFHSSFNFIDTNYILSVQQLGFLPENSFVHQLISIFHEICNVFNTIPSLEVRGVSLYISKACVKVWIKGLLYEIKCTSMDGKFLNLVESFFKWQIQSVILNGQASSWTDFKAPDPDVVL